MSNTMYKLLPVILGTLLIGCADTPEMLAECDAASGKSICGIQNPEDMDFLPGSEWIILSEMISEADPENPIYGSIKALNLSTLDSISLFDQETKNWFVEKSTSLGDLSCPGKPDPTRFGGHGLDVRRLNDGTILLAAVNHGDREAVELFSIDDSGNVPRATWRGCVPLDREIIHNDVAITASGELYISHFVASPHYISARLIKDLYQLYVGEDTGVIYHWTPAHGLTIVPNSEGSAPNGISISQDDRFLFVAEWGENKVYRLNVGDDEFTRDEVSLPVSPDNFSWADSGKLIATGQEGEQLTNVSCTQLRPTTCNISFGVYEVDPKTLAVSEVYKGIGAESVSLIDGQSVFIGTFAGDNIQKQIYADTAANQP